jgi:hypothetical protein
MGQPVQPAQAVVQPAALPPPPSLAQAIAAFRGAALAVLQAQAPQIAALPQQQRAQATQAAQNAALQAGINAYQQYIVNNQALLTQRYTFAIPNNDTSYDQLAVVVPNHIDAGPHEYGLHAPGICESSTDRLAYILAELIRNGKYMQAAEQLDNCIQARVQAMAGWGGGNLVHRRVVGVLKTIQEIIGRVGIQNIADLEVNYPPGLNPASKSVIYVTLNNNPGQPLRFRRVIHPGPVPGVVYQAGQQPAPRQLNMNPHPSHARVQVFIRFTGQHALQPGEFLQQQYNIAGGKRRKTRHAKKSKKNKTRKH